MGAKNILEVGTPTGFSGIFLVEIANKNGGKLTSVEIDEERYNTAKEKFLYKNEVGEKKRVDFRRCFGDTALFKKKRGESTISLSDASKGNINTFLRKVLRCLTKRVLFS